MKIIYLPTTKCYCVTLENSSIASIMGRRLFQSKKALKEALKECGLKVLGNSIIADDKVHF